MADKVDETHKEAVQLLHGLTKKLQSQKQKIYHNKKEQISLSIKIHNLETELLKIEDRQLDHINDIELDSSVRDKAKQVDYFDRLIDFTSVPRLDPTQERFEGNS